MYNLNRREGSFEALLTHLQGKSVSALHMAMQFSRVGRRPRFLMFCWIMKPSTDSKVQARLQVAEGRHSFCT